MKHFEINQLDFSQYRIINVEVIGGSRPRLVLEKGAYNLKHFLKSYSHNSREIISELLASKLGALAGFRIQKTWIKTLPASLKNRFEAKYSGLLPTDWKPIGALVKNIFPRGYNIRYGFNIVKSSPTAKLKLSVIEQAIRDRYYAPQDLIQSLIEMIVFDFWIGNMDRHHENWGILENAKVNFEQKTMHPQFLIEKRRFTDLFDHGSSLLFELDENKVIEYLNDKNLFTNNYILKSGYSHILGEDGKNANAIDLIEFFMKKKDWEKYFRIAIKKICDIDRLEIAKLVLQMPSHDFIDYSEQRRQLLFHSLCVRLDLLSNLIK